MRRNTEETKRTDETISDHEIWSAIRYLDPETETKASKIAVASTIFAIFSIICMVCILLHLRGL